MNRERLISTFFDIVKVNSVSKDEKALALRLKAMLEEMGFETIIDDAHIKAGSNTGNLIAKISGNKNVPAMMLAAHLDTVNPGLNIKPQIIGDVITSDGTTILAADDKAGIASILEGVKSVIEKDISHGDIEIVFTICEEIGLLGAKYLDHSILKSKTAFVFDSSGDVGTVIVQGPAQKLINARIDGKAAHAGLSPEKGVDAIVTASRAISSMKLGRIDKETTANIGIIRGGHSTNIVCDLLNLEAEARSLDPKKLDDQVIHMIKCLEDACNDANAKLTIDTQDCYTGFSIDSSDPILKIAEAAMRRSNIIYTPKSTGGGSDTNILNKAGIKAVTLGVGMSNSHSTEEFITIDNLEKAALLVEALIQEMK
ncbi:MAG TPA: peptidase M20 [Clostridiaceae bacterium]|nr:peptidase M20 [Clostridiaceae bacterium]